jgi:hypothetical protein
MMKPLAVRLVLAWFVLLGGCAHDARVRMTAPPGAPTGTLILLFTQPANDVAVAVNGLLVVQASKTGRVVIENIPVGTADIVVVANGGDRTFKLWIDDAQPVTMPMGVPDASMGFVKTLMGSLISLVVYSLLR